MSETTAAFVGQTSVSAYVQSYVSLLQSGAREASKARGRGIGRPVDVVEIARKLFMPENKVGPMKMGTERVRPSQGGAPIDLGSIELTVSK